MFYFVLKNNFCFAVDGGYGPWGEFSDCTVTCGGGTRERTRLCDNPKPEFGGKTCEGQGLGESVQTESCNVELPCPSKWCYSVSTRTRRL